MDADLNATQSGCTEDPVHARRQRLPAYKVEFHPPPQSHRRAQRLDGSARPRTLSSRAPSDIPPHQSADSMFEQLCRTACERHLRGLRVVHKACRAIVEVGGSDFRLCAIGPLIEQLGGPTTRSLSNPWAKPYRILINAHSHEAMVRRKRGSRVFPFRQYDENTKPAVLCAQIALLENRCTQLQREVNRLSYSQCVQNKC